MPSTRRPLPWRRDDAVRAGAGDGRRHPEAAGGDDGALASMMAMAWRSASTSAPPEDARQQGADPAINGSWSRPIRSPPCCGLRQRAGRCRVPEAAFASTRRSKHSLGRMMAMYAPSCATFQMNWPAHRSCAPQDAELQAGSGRRSPLLYLELNSVRSGTLPRADNWPADSGNHRQDLRRIQDAIWSGFHIFTRISNAQRSGENRQDGTAGEFDAVQVAGRKAGSYGGCLMRLFHARRARTVVDVDCRFCGPSCGTRHPGDAGKVVVASAQGDGRKSARIPGICRFQCRNIAGRFRRWLVPASPSGRRRKPYRYSSAP